MTKPAALPPAFALLGPTASGKSAAALALAARAAARGLRAEIISVDSALVYRGMDIGTAKPTAAERAQVPHHLIDIREPTAPYSAADFVADTRRLIAQIHACGAVPLLAGGTMLYIKALTEGLDALPRADAATRAALEAEAARHGWPALHARLAAVDAATAARLAPTDSQRIQRALEVWHVTGRPMSALHTIKSRAADADGTRTIALFSLEPQDRAWLHARIARRFDAMLADGFLDEVRRLRARGDLRADLPAMRCVGYRQAWAALDEGWPPEALRERGVAATRQLAKRQLTWLRSMPARHIIACDAPDALARVTAAFDTWLDRREPPGATPGAPA